MTVTAQIPAAEAAVSGRQWWRGGVIYQVYPRSFRDTNGDGIGDLPGITEKLPYIASLGVDAVWISPFFRSPMKDYGYDVSDYRDIDPMFGTLDDFDVLLGRAHALGLRVLIDLVLSHTSDKHLWFHESRASETNAKSDWYVWSDAKLDGTPPNNWLSVFGGSAWHWEPRREQYYLHNFLASQPDLNFHTPQVQDAVLGVARFWLDRGVDGFRLDTINFYFHDSNLRDNPALAPEDRNANIAPSVNPYNHQNHLYSKNQPENLDFLERFRSLLDEYDARACVGEIGDAQKGLELLGQYTAGETRANMCYAFEFLSGDRLGAQKVADVLTDVGILADDGWACWAFSNHDVMRHASRWDLSDAAIRLYATLLACLRGSICIYQGEELGLTEADLAHADLHDPYGIEFWPEFKGRDGCRTPMVWDAQDEFAGFGDGRPWLPICTDHVEKAVAQQEVSESSILNHYRAVLALRKTVPALRNGALDGLDVQGDVLSFRRRDDAEEYFCAFNISDQRTQMSLLQGNWKSVANEIGGAEIWPGNTLWLEPWRCLIARNNGGPVNG